MINYVLWRNEYRADEEGNVLFGPERLIAIFEYWELHTKKDERSETHPPLKERIKRLMKFLDK